LDLGAVDFMAKPVKNKDLLLQQQKIVARITRAATAEIKNFRRCRSVPEQKPEGNTSLSAASPSDQLLVISTGCSGHSELKLLLSQLPNDHNLAIIILLTIPPTFIPSLAEHLDKQSAFSVVPLTDGSPLRTGTCYLGTPGHALRTTSTGREMMAEMPTHRRNDSGHDVSYLDLFLCSAVDCYPGSLMVVVLSGAETGNLEGLRYVKERGARIIVQDPATCMVAEPPTSVVAAGLEGTLAAPEAILDDIRHWAGNSAVG
jgi:two-component system chemotaxis response regulator CheB